MIQDFFNFTIPLLDSVPIIRGILGFILVFFLPGFAWTLVFFKHINNIERIVLSSGLSIALVTLSVLFANIVFNIRITGINSLLTIIIIIAVPLVIFFGKKWVYKKKALRS